ncbi:unnamed protein product, partial [marine sediment metagenome]
MKRIVVRGVAGALLVLLIAAGSKPPEQTPLF